MFELTESRWWYYHDSTAHFTFDGIFDGESFVFVVPVKYSFSTEEDSYGLILNVLIPDESECTTGGTLKLDGVEVPRSDERHKRFLKEKDLSNKQIGWSALSDQLLEFVTANVEALNERLRDERADDEAYCVEQCLKDRAPTDDLLARLKKPDSLSN